MMTDFLLLGQVFICIIGWCSFIRLCGLLSGSAYDRNHYLHYRDARDKMQQVLIRLRLSSESNTSFLLNV